MSQIILVSLSLIELHCVWESNKGNWLIDSFLWLKHTWKREMIASVSVCSISIWIVLVSMSYSLTCPSDLINRARTVHLEWRLPNALLQFPTGLTLSRRARGAAHKQHWAGEEREAQDDYQLWMSLPSMCTCDAAICCNAYWRRLEALVHVYKSRCWTTEMMILHYFTSIIM